MANFTYLEEKTAYQLFAPAAIEAEKVFYTSAAMCAVGCRKALELAVKWVYSADNTIQMPYKDNLSSLIHEDSFRYAVDNRTWRKLPYIVKLGNMSVHTDKEVSRSDAYMSLKGLFEFIQWLDCCYGETYEVREFDQKLIPKKKVFVDTKKIKEQESLIEQKEAEIEKLRKKIEEMSASYTSSKEENQNTRDFTPEDDSEYTTRKKYIDVDLKFNGWKFDGPSADVQEEYEFNDMLGMPGKKGYADYVLFGKDGLPLAVIEAKRFTKDPMIGATQAKLYADCLERKFGRRPMIFLSNGFETEYCDDTREQLRPVSGFFGKNDLQKLMNRRTERKDLNSILIDDKITDRYYQKEAIRAVCERVSKGFCKNLLVMATGTGKTRTAASLTDVLSRGGYVTNILFLADRKALVKQAKDDFKNYLPDMSLCNLCSNKDDRNARIVFSTYPTMLNAIDNTKTKDGIPLFTPAHFDLIIVDESHRSIFKKYKTIFEYFDAILVGLTATPKSNVDANTYDFFEMEQEVPTYAYDYETAVYKDHVLVPYYNYEVKTKFLEEGIHYDELSENDKKRYEDAFSEDDGIPEFIPSEALNKVIFNLPTIDMVLQNLMECGIKNDSGDRIGKTIIFAQNKKHAKAIRKRFGKLYPQYDNKFAQIVTCEDRYAQTVIEDFKKADKPPYICISVDMMDTGIDVPECTNLVFFKKVRSKIKFWQMIGRGTRLAPDLICQDQIDGEYVGKKRFLIFDYLSNFEFFREHPNGYEGNITKSLSENIFSKKIDVAVALQKGKFVSLEYQNYRNKMVTECCERVCALNQELISVKLQKKYVEKYAMLSSYQSISEQDKDKLINKIAPLIFLEDKDVKAKRFDNFMYGFIYMALMQKNVDAMKRRLCKIAELLEKKANIPQVGSKLQTIKEIQSDEFWLELNLFRLEKVREDLRGLLQFIEEDSGVKPIDLRLTDVVIDQSEGQILDPAYDFEDYKKKVNRYVEEHGDMISIYKLKHNIPLSIGDYTELERIFTVELGSREDYAREYGDTPFGLLIRKIAKLDHDAAMKAFSEFINDESLNQKQIAFIKKVINYVEKNGYIDGVAVLQKPPFDKPVSFLKIFDAKKRTKLLQTITSIKDNAMIKEA